MMMMNNNACQPTSRYVFQIATYTRAQDAGEVQSHPGTASGRFPNPNYNITQGMDGFSINERTLVCVRGRVRDDPMRMQK